MPAAETRTGKCPSCKADNAKLVNINDLFICEKCASKRFSSRVRKRIQEAYERQEEAIRRNAWKKRIGVAQRGMAFYEKGKMAEALRTFREYIGILENRYGVGHGGLHTDLFDPKKKEIGEIILIAGVYWEMAKIYDHTKDSKEELRHALNKFIEFSINRPHVILASEALRKYLASGKVISAGEFKNAQNVVQTHIAKCFIASVVFGPTAPETLALRKWRDRYLRKRGWGRLAIKIYYAASPPLAAFIAACPDLARILRAILSPFRPLSAGTRTGPR